MKHLYRIFTLIVVLAAIAAGCGNKTEASESQTGEAPEAQQAQQANYPYPALPETMRAALWNECDYVDIIFYESPVSMSQTDAPAIRGTLGYLSGRPAIPDSNCKSLGRISFMRQGEIMIEADMYSRNNCHYFLFLQDGQIVYAEGLSDAGMNFFRQIERRFQEVVQ